VAIGVGGITYALILWAALRYRRRRGDGDDLPRQTRYRVPVEVTSAVIPFLIVIGLFTVSFRTETRVDHVADDPAVVVDVTGFQWQWRFDYPGTGISIVGTPSRFPTMVVPVGQTIEINLLAQDVIHSFYVPDFLFKRDAIPGLHNRFDLTIPTAGVFRGECAEYCGLNHGDMTFYVRAVSPQQFQAWLAGASQGAEAGA
jgi:cytochrome c oxidase subunit 2